MCQSANITSSTINLVLVIALHSCVIRMYSIKGKKKKESSGSFQRGEEKEEKRKRELFGLKLTLSLAVNSLAGNHLSSKTYKTLYSSFSSSASPSTAEPFPLLSKTHTHSNG